MRRPIAMLVGAIVLAGTLGAVAQDDVADVLSKKLQAGNDPNKKYFLIHRGDAREPPQEGFRLLVVLPGGDGSESFHPFVKRIYRHALPEGYLVAQPVAVKWTSGQRIVWPHKKTKVSRMRFTTEEFVEAVIADVRKHHKINGRHVFTLSWSSSGPAAYAASLQRKKSITGSYVAMSVFKKKFLPPLTRAKGHRTLPRRQGVSFPDGAAGAKGTLREGGPGQVVDVPRRTWLEGERLRAHTTRNGLAGDEYEIDE